jgi:regulator of replication initiation timing
MEKRPTTIEALAATIYTHIANKEDIKALRAEMNGMKGTMQEMVEELTATHEDVRYLRRSVDMLVHNDVAQDAAIKILTARVTRLEKKVGLAN